MSFSQPGILQRAQGRLLEYARQHRNLTACILLALAYLVVCVLLKMPYYYVALLVVGLSVLIISLKYPFAAYLGYVFIIHFLPYGYLVSRTFTLAKVGGVFLLAVTLAVTAIRTPELGRRIRRVFDKRGIALLVLILASAVSSIFNRNPNPYFYEQHVQLLILFALTRVYVDTEKRLWWVLGIILLARGLDGVLGFYQYITIPDVGRIAGNFLDPNEYACYTVIAIPIAFYLAQYGRNALLRIGTIVLGFFTFAAIIISYSRAGFITLALVLIIILCIPVTKFRNRLIMFCVAIVLVVAFVPFDYWTRIETISSLFEDEHMERSIMIRKRQLDTSIQFFLDNPIFGVGFQRYRSTPEKLLGGYVIKRWRLGEHSTFLQVLAEVGLCGFIPFLILIFLVFRSGIRAMKLSRSADAPGMHLLATTATVSFASLIIYSFMLGTYTKYLFLFFALPMTAYDIMTDELNRRETVSEGDSPPVPADAAPRRS
jgi:putative inorganic carbon (HCO3(-)) transporter